MGLFNLRKNKRYNHSGRYTEDVSYLGKHSVPRKGIKGAALKDLVFLHKDGVKFYRNRINTYLKKGMIQAEAEAKAMEDFKDFHYRSVGAVPIKMKSKFDEFRTTVGDNNSFRKKFRNAVEDYKNGADNSVRKRLIIIFIILIALFLMLFLI